MVVVGSRIRRASLALASTAIQWGWGVEETAKRLMELSTKAQENGGRYGRITANKAAAAVSQQPTHKESALSKRGGRFH
jgi:hypothetical protein